MKGQMEQGVHLSHVTIDLDRQLSTSCLGASCCSGLLRPFQHSQSIFGMNVNNMTPASSVGGDSIHDLLRWFNSMELASSDCDVPKEKYLEVAIYFLMGELKEVVLERKEGGEEMVLGLGGL